MGFGCAIIPVNTISGRSTALLVIHLLVTYFLVCNRAERDFFLLRSDLTLSRGC